jgi:hypothetical protein
VNLIKFDEDNLKLRSLPKRMSHDGQKCNRFVICHVEGVFENINQSVFLKELIFLLKIIFLYIS